MHDTEKWSGTRIMLRALLKQSVPCPADHHDLSECVPACVSTRDALCTSERSVKPSVCAVFASIASTDIKYGERITRWIKAAAKNTVFRPFIRNLRSKFSGFTAVWIINVDNFRVREKDSKRERYIIYLMLKRNRRADGIDIQISNSMSF